MSENEDEPDSVDGDESVTPPFAGSSIAHGFRLSPSAYDAINQAVNTAGAVTAYRDSMLKSFAPAVESLRLFQNSMSSIYTPQLAQSLKTFNQMNTVRYDLAVSPGMKALTDSMATYQRPNTVMPLQMKMTSDAVNAAARFQTSLPVTSAIKAIAESQSKFFTQQADIATSIKPMLDQFNGALAANYKTMNAFKMANAASIMTAAQSLASVRDSLKLQQSFAVSDMAKTLFASSQALRSIDFETLSRIDLAEPYADRVSDVLAEDSSLAEIVEEIEQRWIERFKTSRETAHKTVETLIWFAMVSAIICSAFVGPAIIPTILGSISMATSHLNADSVAKVVANKVVPLKKSKDDGDED